jgi:hypothetical protein
MYENHKLHVLREVPVFGAADVCKFAFTQHNSRRETHCALGWAKKLGVRTYHSTPTRAEFLRAYVECAALILSPCVVARGAMYINDCGCRTNAERAHLLNATFARLGYVVGQDPAAVRLAREVARSRRPRRVVNIRR